MDSNTQNRPIQNVPPPVSPQVPPSRGWIKWVVLIIIAIIFFSTGTYFLIQSQSQKSPEPIVQTQAIPTSIPEPTANWQVYSNSGLEISFKYPSDWMTDSYEVAGYKEYHGVLLLEIKGKEYGPQPATLSLSYWDNPDNLSLDEFEKKFTGLTGSGPGVYSPNPQVKKISGIDSYYIEKGDCSPNLCNKYVIPYKGKIYAFDIYKPIEQEDQVTVNRILSTFKFLDQADETANWKTYRNTEYGFEFKYPDSFLFKETDQRKQGGSFLIALAPMNERRDLLSYHLIQLSITGTDMTINDFINGLCDFGVCASFDKAIDLNIAGLPAKRVVPPAAPVDSEIAVFKKGSDLYVFNITLDKSYEELLTVNEEKKIFNRMLSTFRFIN